MSCLFNSLGYLIDTDPSRLRQEICSYLQQNPSLMKDVPASDVVQWESDTCLDAYITSMRRSHTWGGSIEIKCFCDMTGYSVHVHDTRSVPRRVIQFTPTTPVVPNKILSLRWSGSHYTPL